MTTKCVILKRKKGHVRCVLTKTSFKVKRKKKYFLRRKLRILRGRKTYFFKKVIFSLLYVGNNTFAYEKK